MYGPSGNELTEQGGSICAEFILTNPQNGTYTIIAEESGGNVTGPYTIFVQRSKDSGNVSSLNFGENLSSNISSFGELDTYTFHIEEGIGQSVIVRMSDLPSTGFFPLIRVFSPSGQQLSSVTSNTCAEFVFTVVDTGQYTVWAYESGGDVTGAYGMVVQKSLNPENTFSQAFGINSSNTISTFGQVDTYTFHIEEGIGQSVIVRMSDLPSTGFFPLIRVFSPSGQQLSSVTSNTCAEFVFTVVDTGQYTVWAYESGGDVTGAYGLVIQKSFNPENTVELTQGSMITESIATFGELDSYTFSFPGPTGGNVMLQMLEIQSTGFFPQLTLFTPDGQLIAEDIGSQLAEILAVLPDTGQYTVWARESGGDATAAYELSLNLPLGIENEDDPINGVIPKNFSLKQNYPNPFNPTTQIPFALPQREAVELVIVNINGQVVRNLLDGVIYAAGEHAVNWDGRNNAGGRVASGLYLYTIRAGDFTANRRMILLR
ncbi:MAG: T9SS type A sorting domain-containing protein [Calditrichota bacterium]